MEDYSFNPSTRYSIVISGILLIAIGLLILFNYSSSLVFILFLVGIFSFVHGAEHLFMGIQFRHFMNASQHYLLIGVFGIILGFIFVIYSYSNDPKFIRMIFAFWMLIVSINGLIEAASLPFITGGVHGLTVLVSVIGLFFAAILFSSFGLSGLMITVIIGNYAILLGINLLCFLLKVGD